MCSRNVCAAVFHEGSVLLVNAAVAFFSLRCDPADFSVMWSREAEQGRSEQNKMLPLIEASCLCSKHHFFIHPVQPKPSLRCFQRSRIISINPADHINKLNRRLQQTPEQPMNLLILVPPTRILVSRTLQNNGEQKQPKCG